MKRNLFALLIISLFAAAIFAQNATESKTDETSDDELKEAARILLRETIVEINGLRTRENRMSFTAEAAALVWLSNEQEGRNMFANAAGELIHVLRELDGQINTMETVPANDTFDAFLDPSEKHKVIAKMQRAMQVRQQLSMSIADHDPDLAVQFFYDSGAAITNEEMAKRSESTDAWFEYQLLSRIAQTNAKKAADLLTAAMNKKLNATHLRTVETIYGKDAELGVRLGSIVLGKLKSGDEVETSLLLGYYVFAADTGDDGKPPLYSNSELRELGELLAAAVMKGDEEYSAERVADALQASLPGRAAQIRAKYKITTDGKSSGSGTGSGMTYTISNGGAPPPPMPGRPGIGISEEKTDPTDPMAAMAGLANNDLPKEKRDEAIAKARASIAKMSAPMMKIPALGMLAAQVARSGDQALADEIMRDAEMLTPAEPVTMADYMLKFMVISAYSESNPAKAMDHLDGLLYKANDLIESFVDVGEFIDITGNIVVDGEVMTGGFGGGMVRGLTGEMAVAKGPVTNLARADLARLNGILNRIRRPEIRIVLKMMVLSAILSEPAKKDAAVEEIMQMDAN